MTATSPSCSLDHGALSAMGFASRLRPGEDYDFVTTSPRPPLEVSADFVGMFTPHSPNATALITYLSSTAAQTAWVKQTGGYAFSADADVPPSAYPSGVERRIAAMLQPRSGYTLCFSAADMMQPDLSAAFYRAVLDYVADAGKLTDLLRGLKAVQDAPNAPSPPTTNPCAAH
jgi:alpha-glucoside transport system substrate-binding protein